MNYCALYNPAAGNQRGMEHANELVRLMAPEKVHLVSLQEIKDYPSFFASLPEDERFVLVGGDGTLNRFINASEGCRGEREIYYFPAGSGNDFWTDIGHKLGEKPVCINRYIEHLPVIHVNGMHRRFVNGIGYGIDGYCCQEGDVIRAKHPGKRINYTILALKGLLWAYRPTNAQVEVDGQRHTFTKVWLAPTMIGRYFGGGMKATPDQHRLNGEHTVSCMVMHTAGKLLTAILFPSVFDGKHVRFTKFVRMFTGHHVKVRFDRPVALQIDGETVSNVQEYTVDYPSNGDNT